MSPWRCLTPLMRGTWLQFDYHVLKPAALQEMWGRAEVCKLACIRITWRSCAIQISGSRVSDSGDLDLGLRICFSCKTAGDTDAANPRKTLVEGKKPELKNEKGLDLYPWRT